MSAERSARRPPVRATVARAQVRLILGRRRRGLLIALGIVVVQLVAAAAGGVLFGVTISSGNDQPTPAIRRMVARRAFRVLPMAQSEGRR